MSDALDKKAKQAASRRKQLREHTGLEVSATGNRFKLNHDHAGLQHALRADGEIPEFDPPVVLTLPPQPPDLQFLGPLVSFENVSYRYPNTSTDTLVDITVTIHPGERIGVAGFNGSGKSTLIDLLLGSTRRAKLLPTKGSITMHPKARRMLLAARGRVPRNPRPARAIPNRTLPPPRCLEWRSRRSRNSSHTREARAERALRLRRAPEIPLRGSARAAGAGRGDVGITASTGAG